MSAAAKSRPIIFRGDMVRAIREGRKTQTRRVVKETGLWEMDELDDGTPWPRFASYVDVEPECAPVPCPYGVPGDELFVRETGWLYKSRELCVWAYPDGSTRTLLEDWSTHDEPPRVVNGKPWRASDYSIWKKSPSILMPRWASRLTLVVRSVRVERLSEISNNDAEAEGFGGFRDDGGRLPDESPAEQYLAAFRAMHKLPADADPWLWVVTFGVKP